MTKIEFSENKCWLDVCHLISQECILLWECAGQIQVAAFRKFMADLGQFSQNEGTPRLWTRKVLSSFTRRIQPILITQEEGRE